MRRHLVGLSSLVLLAVAVALCCYPETPGYAQAGICARLGLVLAAFWLAYDGIQRLPGWVLAGLPILVLVLVKWPRWLFLFLPLILLLAILRPRFGRKS